MSFGAALILAAVLAALVGGYLGGRFLVAGPWHWALRVVPVLVATWAIGQAVFGLTGEWVVAQRETTGDAGDITAGWLSVLIGVTFGAVTNVTFVLAAWVAGLAAGAVRAIGADAEDRP